MTSEQERDSPNERGFMQRRRRRGRQTITSIIEWMVSCASRTASVNMVRIEKSGRSTVNGFMISVVPSTFWPIQIVTPQKRGADVSAALSWSPMRSDCAFTRSSRAHAYSAARAPAIYTLVRECVANLKVCSLRIGAPCAVVTPPRIGWLGVVSPVRL